MARRPGPSNLAMHAWRALLLGSVLVVAGCASASRPAAPAGATAVPPATPPAVAVLAGPPPVAATPLGETQQALHVLNRLGYGPRPGDVEAVRRIGAAAWIEAQLHPERLDDRAAEAAVVALPVLAMTPRELMEAYPPPRPGMPARPEQSPQRLVGGLAQARLLRARYSERQLAEVMVDFWLNHFNVFSGKGSVRYYLPAYEKDAIRPHALGRFRDLLGAVAHHPAMLFYLDGWLSTAADAPRGGNKNGLNENYARELLELHTLGVNGGYGQADVVEVARAFTGWTIDHPRPGNPRSGGGFVFDGRAHDRGTKTILGQRFPAGGGQEEGERVLDLLARHPATARFVATKLARRFVADEPPPAVVERAAAVFRETDGDIRAVVGAIARSPEFWSGEAYRAKVKTPLEFAVSALRALDAATDAGAPVLRALQAAGQPLYGAQAPIGYPDRAEAWVSPGGLLARLNFSQALAAGRLTGSRVDLTEAAAGDGGAAGIADRLLARLLGGEVSTETRAVIQEALGDPSVLRAALDDPTRPPDVAKVAALVLGSPEFQRR
jgi:uncharacterized protein (DUF1800 family)